ncbi:MULTISPECIES: C39 family peptidase [unclassified Geobacillus]|uniref:C39 family peptidase n=1 Tax=unclassified Geobacillus TaxID=2642459 RepID=UPI000BE31833|nr:MULTISPECIES: C39 family peptidase [unclassified Geobacillus]PDM41678.1 hypothetical protein CN643_15475 [Parageobacillus yumthangensis]RDV23450.1 hypothetical protein DXK91_02520 [Parageobacillus toebii]TXK92528.1 hypothetical protein FVE24_00280 [Parageobacillus sp. SY1]PUF90129.1 hypothetical protein DCC82_14840 [Geobacillus sp. LYN3]TXK88530.1 hypothetical protein FVE68_04275 [Geobacillus sp. AYS3]
MPIVLLLFIIAVALLIIFFLTKALSKSALVSLLMFCLLAALLFNQKIETTIARLTQSYLTKEEALIENVISSAAEKKIKPSVLLDVPAIRQLPELPRGCEVTSLAMLLEDAGVQTDKLTLAKQIKKDPTPFQRKNGKVYFGHPNDGFVGDMYSLTTPGLGVYHKPIKQLAEMYLPDRIIDLTGSDFSVLQQYLSKGVPIWIITNSTYKKLPESAFREWETPRGPIKITYYEHSVVITGYDQDYIYFNDPLTGEKNKKAPKTDFVDAWAQMGRQAITYQPD